ncbi:pyridoxal phosphate-dependent aminotransferase [Flexithrix dorotheae]|uniref:pyridoxal phosphate-dependent aminotransferase n=1 Tax=Flexithrix dorotheae TaxID=70993 RepID=UPI0003801465|nr:pyridoxal phosphate-dependent aminotransferase [Flexithrix dorotheae]
MSENALSNRLKSLSESATLAMAVKARELQAQGANVIKLNLGEPDFQTPQHIKDAAKKAIDEGFTSYPPVAGFPDLKEAIVHKLKRDNGLDYEPANIVASTGAKQSIANVLLSLLNKGDEVIIFTPYWVTYFEQVKLAEGIPVALKGNIENDFKVTAEQLRAAITDKTKAILFSSPCNPTGSVFTKEELSGIASVVSEYKDLYIISDEIYEYINFSGPHHSIAEIDYIKDRVIIVNGLSKGFAMTGWRLGYIAAPKWLAKACDKIQGQVTSGTCTISQKAGVAALTGDLKAATEMKMAYHRRRDLVKGLLDEIPGFKTNLPQGAFYIFPDISYYFGKSYDGQAINNANDLAMFLLNEAHVSIVDGGAFGEPNCVRISFAASDEDLEEAIKRIKTALEKLT